MFLALLIVLCVLGALLLFALCFYLFAKVKVFVEYKEKLTILVYVGFFKYTIPAGEITRSEVAFIKKIFVTLKEKLHTNVEDFSIVVAGGNPAETALLYAGITESANLLMDVIKCYHPNAFDHLENGGIMVDFLAKKPTFSIAIRCDTKFYTALHFVLKNHKEFVAFVKELKGEILPS